MGRLSVTGIFLSLCLIALSACTTTGSVDSDLDRKSYFYKPSEIGSDSLFSPLHNNISYALDSLQLSDNFTNENFSDNLSEVWYHLRHPRTVIENDGGTTRFISRDIFPIDAEHLNESAALLPNYTLHLLGGGITFRKDLEWFRSHNYRYPLLASVTLAMTAELVQEALENDDVIDSDALADFYIFRPIGLALFSSDSFAEYIHRNLNPAVWPSQQSIDLKQHKFINTGISYVYRPPKLDFGKRRGFIYTGLSSLLGLSHQLISGDTLSWGIGFAVKEVTSQREAHIDLKTSAGIFYDRNNSLIWSAVINDAGNTRFRANVYPRGEKLTEQIGYFISFDEDYEISLGVVYRLPLGVGASY